MMLSRNRIWGNVVGGNNRSGYKELKKPLKGETMKAYYDQSNVKAMYPFIANWGKRNDLKEKYQDRKLRIFMRGMKIGQQKGKGKAMDAMSVFEMSGKKASDAQKSAEASFSDDSLGISSDG
jgi:hypothetical protein